MSGLTDRGLLQRPPGQHAGEMPPVVTRCQMVLAGFGVRVGERRGRLDAAPRVGALSRRRFGHTAATYETILESIESGTRADFRRAQGILVLHCWR